MDKKHYLMEDFDLYFSDVKSQLNCNASDEYKNESITYNYSNQIVDFNKDYFMKCMKAKLSPYKALLFFGIHLNGEYEI